jgi:hypothetical protein
MAKRRRIYPYCNQTKWKMNAVRENTIEKEEEG